MVGTKKWLFFFGPKNPHFGPKIRFFVWDPVFWQSGARNPRRWFRFGTFGSSVRLFVSELRPFSRGEPGRRAQKSYPTPLWGHRLPVTALALSARRPFGPARFARGLDNTSDPGTVYHCVAEILRYHRGTKLPCYAKLFPFYSFFFPPPLI